MECYLVSLTTKQKMVDSVQAAELLPGMTDHKLELTSADVSVGHA